MRINKITYFQLKFSIYFSDNRKIFVLPEKVKKLSFGQTCSKTPVTKYSPECSVAAIKKNLAFEGINK